MRKMLVFMLVFLVTFGVTVGIGLFTFTHPQQSPKNKKNEVYLSGENVSVAFYNFPPMVISVPPQESIIFDDPITIIGRP